jgi:hypothetical protein
MVDQFNDNESEILTEFWFFAFTSVTPSKKFATNTLSFKSIFRMNKNYIMIGQTKGTEAELARLVSTKSRIWLPHVGLSINCFSLN